MVCNIERRILNIVYVYITVCLLVWDTIGKIDLAKNVISFSLIYACIYDYLTTAYPEIGNCLLFLHLLRKLKYMYSSYINI